MNIALIEPFYGGSHKQWCDGYKAHSSHDITIFALSAHHWKWRMQGAAITLAEQFVASPVSFDRIIVSDFLNLPLFKSLIKKTNIPIYLYFHENQLTYPWSPDDRDVKLKRDLNYGFINYTSALVADKVFFNSQYHKTSFLSALPKFIKQFPDHNNQESIDHIHRKSNVLYLGMDYSIFDLIDLRSIVKESAPVILWNHRWEYDKNPEDFFLTLFKLKQAGIDFQLIVLGRQMPQQPAIFDQAHQELNEEIIHWGFIDDNKDYARLLWQADIIPVTCNQDFFGISVVEALYCQTYPLLPRRLAYAEHLHPDSDEYYYTDTSELFEKLVHCCTHIKEIRQSSIKQNVNRYNWKTLSKHYDETFS